MKIRFLIAISFASLQAQASFAGSPAQLSPPTLQPTIVVTPSPQPKETPKAAVAQATAAVALPQWHGQYEGDSEFSTQTIRTQESWAQFWSRIGRPMPQALDESREMAIFVAVGERPTGGFIPRVLSAAVRDGKFVVEYSDGKPSPETFVTQAFTRPWVVAIVAKSSLPVVMQGQGAR